MSNASVTWSHSLNNGISCDDSRILTCFFRPGVGHKLDSKCYIGFTTNANQIQWVFIVLRQISTAWIPRHGEIVYHGSTPFFSKHASKAALAAESRCGVHR
jgi:hypothetical protein